MSFTRRNEAFVWALSWLLLMGAIVVSSIVDVRWLTYFLVGVAVVDLLTRRRLQRWIRRRRSERGR
jgi:hypothetical protein